MQSQSLAMIFSSILTTPYIIVKTRSRKASLHLLHIILFDSYPCSVRANFSAMSTSLSHPKGRSSLLHLVSTCIPITCVIALLLSSTAQNTHHPFISSFRNVSGCQSYHSSFASFASTILPSNLLIPV
jgi:hypothetical protein